MRPDRCWHGTKEAPLCGGFAFQNRRNRVTLSHPNEVVTPVGCIAQVEGGFVSGDDARPVTVALRSCEQSAAALVGCAEDGLDAARVRSKLGGVCGARHGHAADDGALGLQLRLHFAHGRPASAAQRPFHGLDESARLLWWPARARRVFQVPVLRESRAPLHHRVARQAQPPRDLAV